MSEICTRCGTACLLARDEAANGSTQVFWWCVHCARVADPRRPFVSKDYARQLLRGEPVESLPVIRRYAQPLGPQCQVNGCSRHDTEYHHIAPRHLFEDAELWPGVYLCTFHHKQWHDVVTPKMHLNGRKVEPAR